MTNRDRNDALDHSTEQSERDVVIDIGTVQLPGDLWVPSRAHSIIVFAHGSGSSRHSPRNRAVAEFFCRAGLATLLFDLLTAREEAEEEYTRRHRFNIPFLTDRLCGALHWLAIRKDIPHERVGLFGSSTGAAAALEAAARDDHVHAVVSRGGRPDLADKMLPLVKCPVLLLVGSLDTEVLALNRQAARKLSNCQLDLVPGATHLFSEPGT